MNRKLIFCFTYAGGTADFYKELADELKEDFELVCFEYPGHGKRRKEELCSDFDEVVDRLYPELKGYLADGTAKEYAMLGYSMGSLVAFAMLRRITEDASIPLPVHVFLAAHEPMTKVNIIGIPAEKLDDYVRERTIAFNAVPDSLIDNKVFWRTYLPVYKADYLMIARYHIESIVFRTDVPCTVFYSETDTRLSDMQKWSAYFVHDCRLIEYDGGHFFINKHCDEMAEEISERLKSNDIC